MYPIYRNVKDNIYTKLIDKDGFYDEVIQDRISEEKIEKLFINKSDRSLYKNDIQSYLDSLIDKKETNLEQKVELVYNFAYENISEAFESEVTEEKIDKICDNLNNIVDLLKHDMNALNMLLDINTYDFYTYTHSIDVATYAIAFGIYLNLSKEDLLTLGKAAIFHDIGKKKIDRSILTKEGKLTEYEFEIMKLHPSYSVEILQNVKSIDNTTLIVIAQHHEKLDGSGYPLGLQEDNIHPLSKILAIVDIFNALTTIRSYKDDLSYKKGLELMFTTMQKKICFKYLSKFVQFVGTLKNK